MDSRETKKLLETFFQLEKACGTMYELVMQHNERINELESRISFLENNLEDSKIC